jgi:hypothetical protein
VSRENRPISLIAIIDRANLGSVPGWRDEHADPSWDIESSELDRSVLTGRTLKEIEEGRSRKMPRPPPANNTLDRS